MKKYRVYLCFMLILMLMSNSAMAAEAPFKDPNEEEEKEEENVEYAQSNTVSLTLEAAVTYALENNYDLQTLKRKHRLAEVKLWGAKDSGSSLKSAKSSLESAESLLNSKTSQLTTGAADLAAAKTALSSGIAPVDIPLADPSSGDPILDPSTGDQIIISAGSDIRATLTAIISVVSGLDPVKDAAIISAQVERQANTIEGAISQQLAAKEAELEDGKVAIAQASGILEANWSAYNSVINDASRELEANVDYSSTITLDAQDASDLMIKMADVNLSLTDYAEDIYRNQVGMLIRKNYYDALYAQTTLELKGKAMERGKVQFEKVELSYENGMKAKDDYLLAKMYYDGTIIAHRLAEAEYNNALSDLKENMNIDQKTKIELVDNAEVVITQEDLDEAIKSAKINRLEVQQCLGKEMICQMNRQIILDMDDKDKEDFNEIEAEVLLQEAMSNLDRARDTVDKEVRQSYEMMSATGDMLIASETLVENAQEVVSIAELKYEQGFGSENSLLANMGLESSSGTIIELLAAQENLAEVEAQVANIKYNYIMARCKFYNDAGILKD